VIDRWKDLMTIELWNFTDIYTPSKKAQNYSENTKRQVRQNFFNRKCIEHLKEKDRGWVFVVDVDEFVLLHPNFKKKGFKNTSLPINEPGSVLSFLNQHSSKLATCLPMHRRQITSKESSQAVREDNVPKFVNTSNLLTTRFLFQRDYGGEKRYIQFPKDVHAKKKGAKFAKKCGIYRGRLAVKVVINLKQIHNIKTLNLHGTPHRPIMSLCTKTYISSKNSPLVVNHYLPTWEQWNYRDDIRGVHLRALKFHLFSMYPSKEKGAGVRLWAQGFNMSVGETEALRLLDGVGQLESYSGQHNPRNVLPHMPNFYRNETTNGEQIYQVGDWVNVNHSLAKIVAYQSNNHYYVITNTCEYHYDVAQERIQNITI